LCDRCLRQAQVTWRCEHAEVLRGRIKMATLHMGARETLATMPIAVAQRHAERRSVSM
jgi:hypothetical protein